jgi:hypothetical protein
MESVNQLNRVPDCRKIKVCKGFVKEQDIDFVNKNSGNGNPLFLSA